MVSSAIAIRFATFVFGGSVTKRAAVLGVAAVAGVLLVTGFYIKGRMAQEHKQYVKGLEQTIRGQALAIETNTAASMKNHKAALEYKERADRAEEALEKTGTAGHVCFDKRGTDSLRQLWKNPN